MPGYTGEINDETLDRALRELQHAVDFEHRMEQNVAMRHIQMQAQSRPQAPQAPRSAIDQLMCHLCGRIYASNVTHDCIARSALNYEEVVKFCEEVPEVQLCEGVGTFYELAPIDRVSPKV